MYIHALEICMLAEAVQLQSPLEPADIYCSFCAITDRQSSNASLETLLALLQAEGAKIEEDTEVMTVHFNSATYTHY